MKLTLLAFIFISAAGLLAAEITFKGYMVMGNRPVFTLSSSNDKSSDWITIGQSFEGYKIIRFYPKTGTLTLDREGHRSTVQLSESKTASSKPIDRIELLKSLQGMELAYELAKTDDEMVDLLKRHQEATVAQEKEMVISFLRLSIEKRAAEKAAKIIKEN